LQCYDRFESYPGNVSYKVKNMTCRYFLILRNTRIWNFPVFAITLLLITINPAQSRDIRFAPQPTGPDLRVQTADKFFAWKNENAPQWFIKKIKHEGRYVWGPSEKEIVYFDEMLRETTKQIATRTKSGCWLVTRQSIEGTRYEVRYGVMYMKLGTTSATRIQLVELLHSTENLAAKKTMEEVVNSQDKSIIKFLAEQVPILGEIIDKGTSILGTGDVIEKMVEVQAALNRFRDDYNRITNQIGKKVVTVEGGYDAGQARSLGNRKFGSTEKRENADCDTKPWNTMKPGESQDLFTSSRTLTPDARAVLLEELEQPEKERDFGKVFAIMAQSKKVKTKRVCEKSGLMGRVNCVTKDMELGE